MKVFVAGASGMTGRPLLVSPDAWTHAQSLLDRQGTTRIQLALLHDYGSNLKRYPEWQAYFREHRSPTSTCGHALSVHHRRRPQRPGGPQRERP